jgi:hypothetical protein
LVNDFARPWTPPFKKITAMNLSHKPATRRGFMKTTAVITSGLTGISLFPGQAENAPPSEDSWSIVGPREGFSPQVGTLYSMMNMMRFIVLAPLKDLSVAELDYLHDANSNSIGSMLLHLAATERYYQLNTFDNMKWKFLERRNKKGVGHSDEAGTRRPATHKRS